MEKAEAAAAAAVAVEAAGFLVVCRCRMEVGYLLLGLLDLPDLHVSPRFVSQPCCFIM